MKSVIFWLLDKLKNDSKKINDDLSEFSQMIFLKYEDLVIFQTIIVSPCQKLKLKLKFYKKVQIQNISVSKSQLDHKMAILIKNVDRKTNISDFCLGLNKFFKYLMRLNNNKLFEFLLEIQNYNFEIHDEARQQFREYKKHAKITPSFHFGPLDKLTV